MLQAAGEEAGALDLDRVALDVEPVTFAQFARPVGNDSPGTERQPSQSSSGSGMVSGSSDVSSFGLTTTPLCRTPSSSGQS